jgi:hypothetical protein
MSYITKAIFKLKPTAEFSFYDEDYSTIKWDVLDGVAPTQDEIDEAIKQIKASEIKENADKATAREAILERLGLTADEAAILLG